MLVFVFAIAASATAEWYCYWVGAVLLLLELYRAPVSVALSALSLAVLGFCLWLIVHTLVISPVFKPEAVFAAWLLGASFLIATRLTSKEGVALGKLVVGIVAILALWGCLQHWFNIVVAHPEGGRAHAWFDSPNTLATLISIVLVPLVVHVLRSGSRIALIVAAVLVLGLLGTQSRGGWLACFVGLMVCAVLVRRAGLSIKPGAVGALGGLVVLGSIVSMLPQYLGKADHVSRSTTERLTSGLVEGDTAGRTALYETAWEQITLDPWIGPHRYTQVLSAAANSLASNVKTKS